MKAILNRTAGFSGPAITVRPGAIGLNKAFSKAAEGYNAVYVKADDDTRTLEINLVRSTEERPGSYRLTQNGGREGRTPGRVFQSAILFQMLPWLDKVGRLEITYRRFKATQISPTCWQVCIAPTFEQVIERSQKPPKGAGIYVLLKCGRPVYYGHGRFPSRFREHNRSRMDYDQVGYSEVIGKNFQEEWENYWINRYEQENRVLPRYNKNRGKKPKNVP